MQWSCSAIPIVQPHSQRMLGMPVSSCTFRGRSQRLCSYPAVGEDGVTVLNQHRFDDLGVCDSQCGLSAIVNPGGGRRGGR